QEVYLVNALEQRDGRGPAASSLPLERATKLLKFVVDASIDPHGDPSRIPDRLLELPPVEPADAVTERTFVFDRANGGWRSKGPSMDPGLITATPRLGTAEIWSLVNASSAWMHPLHIPLEAHQVVSRNGSAPPPDDVARHDVVALGPGETVKIFLRFRDFLG